MKTCTKCRATKPLSEFFARKGSSDGRMSSCKACKYAAHCAWREKNYDRWLELVRLDRKRPHRAARIAAYRATLEAKAADRIREASPEVRAKRKAYLKSNPERAAAFDANRNARRRAKAPGGFLSLEDWVEIKRRHNFACLYCGAKPHRLTRDHYIPLAKGGSHSAENIVPACRSCNSAKRDLHPDEFARLRQRQAARQEQMA